jgi:hypothetical protein
MPARSLLKLALCTMLIGLGSALAPARAATQAMRAEDFVESIAVNLHLPYTDGGYMKGNEVAGALAYLGVRYVRDHAISPKMQPESLQNLDRLAASGIRFDMMINGGTIATALGNLRDFETKHPGVLHAVEGPNEINNWPVSYAGKTGTAGGAAFQEALYDAVKADPVLKHLPVYNYTNWPYSAGKADFANIHPYAKKGAQPFGVLQNELSTITAAMPGRPVVITETGYYTLPKAGVGWGGVDDVTQAKLMTNLYLDAALLGIKRTYVYQLLDAYADPEGKDQEKHFGLFDLSYKPKPAATALRNLRTLLHDTDPAAQSFATKPVTVSIQGLPATAKTLTLQKADGTSIVALWNEPDIWDETAAKPIAVPPVTVALNFGAPRAWISAYAPLAGTQPVASASSSATVSLQLSDEPILVVVAAQ